MMLNLLLPGASIDLLEKTSSKQGVCMEENHLPHGEMEMEWKKGETKAGAQWGVQIFLTSSHLPSQDFSIPNKLVLSNVVKHFSWTQKKDCCQHNSWTAVITSARFLSIHYPILFTQIICWLRQELPLGTCFKKPTNPSGSIFTMEKCNSSSSFPPGLWNTEALHVAIS